LVFQMTLRSASRIEQSVKHYESKNFSKQNFKNKCNKNVKRNIVLDKLKDNKLYKIIQGKFR
jgi:hypothetical protein